LADLTAQRLKRYQALPKPEPDEEEELLVIVADKQLAA
jgi:hypothetical protein